jgi:nicotinate-nucleotide adenylyltransferase
MVRLALEDIEYAEPCLVEGERPGPSYTAETLEELARSHPGAELVLVLGEDALADLPNWKDPERIAAAALIAVARRSSGERAQQEAYPGARLLDVNMPRWDISATMLRERVRRGEPIDFYVPGAVVAYTARRGLYRS